MTAGPSAYLDHASTTPTRPQAIAALVAQASLVGNPSSLHSSGRRARAVVEEAREGLAAAVGARPAEVVWTSGGTEADNLAVKGTYWARRAQDPRRTRVLVGAAEHHAVLDCVDWLVEHEGAQAVLLPVDAVGRTDLAALERELGTGEDVALVTLMWANNEVGTLQPVAAAAALAHAVSVPLHTDAVQAVGHVRVDFAASGADSLALSAHKFGGPVGAGALLVRRGTPLTPLQHGGGQELGVRSGTLDAAAAAATAAALTAAVDRLDAEVLRVQRLRDQLVAGLLTAVPGVVLRGDAQLDADHRLPGNAHVTVSGAQGDSLLYLLDAAGVECSTGSACQAGVPQPSHVLLAMGLTEEEAAGALRFSLGWTSSEADVDAALAAVGPAVERSRRAATSTRTARRRRATTGPVAS